MMSNENNQKFLEHKYEEALDMNYTPEQAEAYAKECLEKEGDMYDLED